MKILIFAHYDPVVLHDALGVSHEIQIDGESPLAVLDPATDDLSQHLTPEQLTAIQPYLSA